MKSQTQGLRPRANRKEKEVALVAANGCCRERTSAPDGFEQLGVGEDGHFGTTGVTSWVLTQPDERPLPGSLISHVAAINSDF